MGVIYKITSPTNKLYVGKTYNLKHRIASHKCASKQGKNLILHNSIRKYGWNNHVFEVIEEVADELMNEREIYWVSELKTYCYENENGMNMTKGGDGQRSTWIHKTELRKWFSEKFSGDKNPFFGKKHTEETIKLLSEQAKVRNKKNNTIIPEWGAEKGREVVRRKVVCYDVKGIFLKEYRSITDAAKDLNLNKTNISAVCNNHSSNTNGYLFRYLTENYPLKIEVGEIKYKDIKRPIVTLTEDYEVVCEHPSAQEASDFWGIPKTTINRAAMYNWLVPIRTGHVFIYKDLYEEILKAAS